MRPKIEVNKYETIAIPETGKPPPSLKKIYFQVRNVGKNPAEDCRAVLTIPSRLRHGAKVDQSLPTEIFQILQQKAFQTQRYLMNNMRLEWYEEVELTSHDKEPICLGKSIEMPADPTSFFYAGTILVSRSPESIRETMKMEVDAFLIVELRIFETDKAPKKQIPLYELFDGSSTELELTVSWQYDGRKTQTRRYHVQVESFERINFDEIDTFRLRSFR
jgi:hypothetical protein